MKYDIRLLIVLVMFTLLAGSDCMAASVTATESSDGFIFQESGKNILFYQRSPKSFDGAYTRNNYIHPLWNLDGDVLTEDAPDDHLHQRGIYWTWHQTMVGDIRCGDAWTCERFAWDVTTAQINPLSNEAQRLDVTVFWKSPDLVDDRGKTLPIVKEKTAITVYPRKESCRLIDFEIRLLALHDKVAIGGSEDVKGYGGFSLRIKAPDDLTFESSQNRVQPKNEAVTAGNWLDFNATFSPTGAKNGIAVFVHPDNPGATDKWILRQKRSMQNPVFPGREPATIPRDRPLVLRYRLVIHRGDTASIPLDDMYHEYVQDKQAKIYVVSPSGDDKAVGDAVHPLRTISAAAQRAMPGDTILVKAGVYRERVAPPRGGEPGRPIIYRGEALGKVFVRGSELWQPDWKRHKRAVYSAAPDESLFNDHAYIDSGNPLRVDLASTPYGRNGKQEKKRFDYGDPNLVYTCGQVIINGRPLTQVPFISEVEGQTQTWTYDSQTGQVYVNFGDLNPVEQTVELTTRRRIFAPHVRGLGHIVLEGFVFEHCGNQYPTNFWNTPIWAQAGAVGLRAGHHWIVRNNLIRYAHTVAMDIGASGGNNETCQETSPTMTLAGHDNLIERNYILDNGAAGIIGLDSTRMVVRDNVILRNNTLGFIGNKRYEHAGIKCHNIKDGLIEHNYIADNLLNDGVWLDNRFPGTRVTRNVIVDNGQKGVFLEMSDYDFDTALVDNNILINNRLIQFYVHDASGSTVMHNLIANSPQKSRFGQGAYIYQVTTRTRTYHHSLYNNLFVNHKRMLDINYPSHRGGPQRLDHNVYDAGLDDRTFIINRAADRPSPWNPAEFLELLRSDLGQDAHGLTLTDDKKGVALTLPQWRAFWKKHGLDNDRNSVTQTGISVSYDATTCAVSITVPFDPGTMGSTNHDWIDNDFFGNLIPQNGRALPGPFQNLKRGVNTFVVWDGLPLLAPKELPQ